MSHLDTVDRIKADIAKLPKVFQPLITSPMHLGQKYWWLVAAVAFVTGELVGVVFW